jgi:hypothetical protein
MKTQLPTLIVMLLTLSLGACNNSGAVPAPDDAAISRVYTAAAATLAAHGDLATPATALTPDSGPTPQATPTAIPGTSTSTAASIPSSSSASVCDNSAYVSDVTIPDGTVLTPGEGFVKTWMFENIGTCTWSTGYSVVFINGSKMNGAVTTIDQSVAPGSSAEISVSLTAPDSAGTYTGYWRLMNAAGVMFGESVFVQIVVSGDAATPTSTSASDTGTSTPTAASTAIAASETSTASQTSIPTGTATPTSTTVSSPADITSG